MQSSAPSYCLSESNLVTGPVKVGIQPSLPFEGVLLILGNDLAGDKVVVNASCVLLTKSLQMLKVVRPTSMI